MTLPNWTVCAKLLARGEVLRPFAMKTFPVEKNTHKSTFAKVVAQSRKKYGRSVTDIEAEIVKRYGGPL